MNSPFHRLDAELLSPGSVSERRSLISRFARVPTDVPLGFQTLIEPDDPKLVRYVQEVVKPQLDARFEVIDAGRNNVVLRLGSGSRPRLLIQNYTPAQHHNLMDDPLSGDIVPGTQFGVGGDVVIGQGVGQAKCHQAVMVSVVNALGRLGLNLRGTLYWSINNEGRSSHECTSLILDAIASEIDFCVIQLDTRLAISLGNRGRVDVDVEIKGKAAHSSTPDDGASAIDGAYEVMTRLRRLRWPDSHPLLGSRQAVPYKIDFFPVAPHTLPEVAQMTVDRRLLPGDDVEAATDEIRSSLRDIAPYEVTVQRGVYMLPSLTDDREPWVLALQDGIERTGRAASTIYSRGAFDAGATTSRGIPTVMFGAGGDGHWPTGVDFVSVEDVTVEARVLGGFIVDRLT
jgi:acetylornithine deacetylase/succinyl-diaminopimelate desuccinylase-like protein